MLLFEKALLTFLLLAMCFSKVEAQTTNSFIYPSQVSVNNLTANQAFRRQKLLAQPTTKSLQLVEVNNLFPILSNGFLPLILPNTTAGYLFSTNYIRTYPNGDYTWSGELHSTEFCDNGTPENECFGGSFMAMKKDGQTFGELWLDTSFYQIRDLGEGVSAFIEIDKTELTNGCITPSAPFSGGQGPEDNPPLCPVRILILYTQAALDANPDIVAIANAGIETTKIALRNSEVTENQLGVTLAGVQALTTGEWSETDNLSADISTLAGNPAIAGYRMQYNADLVFILTAGGYTTGTGAVVNFGDTPADVATAFAIVEANAATAPRYTFAHEFGHLFGARHEGTDLCAQYGDDSGLQDAHGYHFSKWFNFFGIIERRDYYTIMDTRCFNIHAARIQHYSNPDVEYKNKKTGRVDKNNNAKVLRDATCRISVYVISNDVHVSISGEEQGCPNTIIGLLAHISGNEPVGPYILKWEATYDWNTWFTLSEGLGPNYLTCNIPVPENAGDKITVRLTLTTPAGNQVFAWHEIRSVDNGGCPQERPSGNRFGLLSDEDINIFPNPNNGVMTLTVKNAKGSCVSFSVINSFGQVIYEQPCAFTDADVFQSVINLPNVASGFYWFKIRHGEKVTLAKIFVTH
ncbi:MAG: T9SS type A sorting domain-containing protein [Saprospiraceae bacterium]|nr:T9SS type A sorting domain-containing protein [Saprospiraceae bacterium]